MAVNPSNLKKSTPIPEDPTDISQDALDTVLDRVTTVCYPKGTRVRISSKVPSQRLRGKTGTVTGASQTMCWVAIDDFVAAGDPDPFYFVDSDVEPLNEAETTDAPENYLPSNDYISVLGNLGYKFNGWRWEKLLPFGPATLFISVKDNSSELFGAQAFIDVRYVRYGVCERVQSMSVDVYDVVDVLRQIEQFALSGDVQTFTDKLKAAKFSDIPVTEPNRLLNLFGESIMEAIDPDDPESYIDTLKQHESVIDAFVQKGCTLSRRMSADRPSYELGLIHEPDKTKPWVYYTVVLEPDSPTRWNVYAGGYREYTDSPDDTYSQGFDIDGTCSIDVTAPLEPQVASILAEITKHDGELKDRAVDESAPDNLDATPETIQHVVDTTVLIPDESDPSSEDCRECKEHGGAPEGDRPFKGDNLCWDCYRHLYPEPDAEDDAVVESTETCPDCAGSDGRQINGTWYVSSPCDDCGGSGFDASVDGECAHCKGVGELPCCRCEGTGSIAESVEKDPDVVDYTTYADSTPDFNFVQLIDPQKVRKLLLSFGYRAVNLSRSPRTTGLCGSAIPRTQERQQALQREEHHEEAYFRHHLEQGLLKLYPNQAEEVYKPFVGNIYKLYHSVIIHVWCMAEKQAIYFDILPVDSNIWKKGKRTLPSDDVSRYVRETESEDDPQTYVDAAKPNVYTLYGQVENYDAPVALGVFTSLQAAVDRARERDAYAEFATVWADEEVINSLEDWDKPTVKAVRYSGVKYLITPNWQVIRSETPDRIISGVRYSNPPVQESADDNVDLDAEQYVQTTANIDEFLSGLGWSRDAGSSYYRKRFQLPTIYRLGGLVFTAIEFILAVDLENDLAAPWLTLYFDNEQGNNLMSRSWRLPMQEVKGETEDDEDWLNRDVTLRRFAHALPSVIANVDWPRTNKRLAREIEQDIQPTAAVMGRHLTLKASSRVEQAVQELIDCLSHKAKTLYGT
jgi:hypothetical protein